MKTILIVAAFAVFQTSSESIHPNNYAFEVPVSDPLKVTKKGNVYSFEISMEGAEADAIIQRLPGEIEELEKASRKKNKVSLTFKEDAPQDRVSKSLLYMATLFGNGELQLSE
jgi:hypothetical protein